MSSVEIRSKTENTEPAGDEWLFAQDPADPFTVKKMMMDTIRDYIADYIGNTLVGEVKHIDPDITTPDFHVDCDGQVISDADSVYNGKRVFNLNGGDVVLTLTWTADAGGAYANVNTNDIKAINKGDWITGSGIAADSIVKSVNESTGRVIISDVAATGSISSTFTNDGVYIGGGESGSDWDQMQKITGSHASEATVNGYSATTTGVGAFSATGPATTARNAGQSGAGVQMAFDSAKSPNARTSATTAGRTKPHTRFLKAIIRIK